jgi:hypothetical protein
MNWLIDGQQRVITLARILSGDEGIEVVFNPREDMFRLANAATRNDRNWVRVAGALADRSGLLALYIACMNRGILDFYTGGKVLLQKAVDRHHILPRAQFAEGTRSAADNVANIAFIVGDVNKSIGQAGPEVYLKRLAARVLKSQCIPEDESLWRVDRASEFWAARRELLASSFNDFLRDSLPQRRLGAA